METTWKDSRVELPPIKQSVLVFDPRWQRYEIAHIEKENQSRLDATIERALGRVKPHIAWKQDNGTGGFTVGWNVYWQELPPPPPFKKEDLE